MDKMTLIKEYLRNEYLSYEKSEHIADLAERINETKGKSLLLDEMGLLHGDEEMNVTLDVYLSNFYDVLIEDVCNVIDSFESEEYLGQ